MAANYKKYAITPISDADGIAASQTLSSGGTQSFNLNGALASGGTATFANAHLVVITSAANDSGRTFVISGIDSRGQTVTNSITGANAGAATSTVYFKTVTGITSNGNTAGAVTIGVNGLCVTPWYVPDTRANPFTLTFSVELSSGASLTYSVEHTTDDLMELGATITPVAHATAAAKTATYNSNYAFPVHGVRGTVTAYTSGTAEMNIIQAR